MDEISTQAAPAAHPVSGLSVVPLTVTSGDKVHNFRVELARTGQEQARGLMFRTAMGADEGMLFPMNPPRGASFWIHCQSSGRRFTSMPDHWPVEMSAQTKAPLCPSQKAAPR